MRSWFLRGFFAGHQIAVVRFAVIAIPLLLAAESAWSFEGREFVAAFPPILNEHHGARHLELQLTSTTGAQVKIDFPFGSTGLEFSRTIYVPAQTTVTVALPERVLAWSTTSVRTRAVNVRTEDPEPARFSVVMIARTRYASDSGQLIPTPMLGTEYLPVMPAASDLKPNNQILLVAAHPGITIVTIVPSTTLAGWHPAGIPYVEILVGPGSGILLRADSSAVPPDLTGTYITSTQPLVVMAADQCSLIPPPLEACDSVFEASLPIDLWGREIPVQGLPQRPSGTPYRIMASQPGTTVSLDGALLSPLLNAGEFLDVAPLVGGHLFTANQPISVLQMMTGFQAESGTAGDPAVGTMWPVEFYSRRHFGAVAGPVQFVDHFVSIIARSSDAFAGRVELNGAPVPASAFTAIGAGDFAGAEISVIPGSCRIESPGPHTVSFVGTHDYDSYLHTLAGRFGDHFLCRRGKSVVDAEIHLEDSRGAGDFRARRAKRICSPADKNDEGVRDLETHLRQYQIKGPQSPLETVHVVDQFGVLSLDVKGSQALLMPASRVHVPDPPLPAPDPATHDVDAYHCTRARVTPGTTASVAGTVVTVSDQFGKNLATRLVKPMHLCLPTSVNGSTVKHPESLLLCYEVKIKDKPIAAVTTTDQLTQTTFEVLAADTLCVPAEIEYGCCTPRPVRCVVDGADAGRCDGPNGPDDCLDLGGFCATFSCSDRCGNGVLDPWCCEECDDGTRLDGDGCSATCKVQPCCVRQPLRCVDDDAVPCDDSSDCERAGVGGECKAVDCDTACGNQIVQPYCCEECDGSSFCNSDCKINLDQLTCIPSPTRCALDTRIGCESDADCPPQTGPCVSLSCDSLCGDGTVDAFCCEECDDGTRLDGDGCSKDCKLQECCVSQPNRCIDDPAVPCDEDLDCDRAGVGGACIGLRCDQQCGDGIIQPWCCERCDDGSSCYGGDTVGSNSV